MRYRVAFTGDGTLTLCAALDQTNMGEALVLLLASQGVQLGPQAQLEPCLDVDEMSHRNVTRRSSQLCN
jgi:hypothetical protein